MVNRYASRANRWPLRRGAAGFTYIGLMLSLAIGLTALAAAVLSWHTAVQRSQEAQLVFIGSEFKTAIQSYYDATPGLAKQLPKKLEDLLRDTRYPAVRRHLRKIYVDPMTGRAVWGLVATPEGISGVYSLSQREPFKGRGSPPATKASLTTNTDSNPTANVAPAADATGRGGGVPALRTVVKYSDWKFVASFSQTAGTTPAPPVQGVPPKPPAQGVQPVPEMSAARPEILSVPVVSPVSPEAAPR